MSEIKDKITITNKHQKRIQVLKNPEISVDINFKNINTPLRAVWSFGWNCTIGLKNILNHEFNKNTLQTFFVTDHIGIFMEYNIISKAKKMSMLTGHRNFISSFDVNPDGMWLVTVDKGNDSMLIVWNSLLRTPVYSVLSPFEMGISIVKFSVDSQYVVTVSVTDTKGEQTISIWEWTLGREESICSTKLDKSIDTIVHLTCCHDNTNLFCLTTEKLIIFMTLQVDINKGGYNITITTPVQDLLQSKYNYTQSAYVTSNRQVLSASTGGWVTVWNDPDYNESNIITNEPITNNKQYLKHVKLDEHPITTIICIQKHIITGNANGDIFFYDKSLLVLYHLNKVVGDPITSIAMLDSPIHIEKASDRTTGAFEKSEEITQSQILRNSDSASGPTSWCINEPEVGADFTVDYGFKCNPLFISTRNCRIFHIDISNRSFDCIYKQCGTECITALGVHPLRNMIVLGNSIGGLVMFNYHKKKITTSIIGNPDDQNDHQITCIKYSPNGNYLCCGRADGLFRFIDPCNLTCGTTSRNKNSVNSKTFKWNESPVQHITFSDSSLYVAYTDNLGGIYMYRIVLLENPTEFNVKYYGCYEVHAGFVRSIFMVEHNTNIMIYSVGADHNIVVLDFDKTENDEHPKLVKSMKTEPYHEPQCMMKSTIERELSLIISGNDLRLSLWEDNRTIRFTLGVNLKSPIRVMKIIDIGVSMDSKYVFSISENSSSMIIWLVNTSYLDKLEQHGGVGLKAYSSLLKGGENGPEMTELKEYFDCVQLANSQNPKTTTITDYVDVFQVFFLMRVMGYFPSEVELCTMLYEMFTRKKKSINHPTTTMTFEEFVILYLNYKPPLELKYGELHQAFNELIQNDQHVNDYGENKILTRESFVHLMTNYGEKINPRELEIILNTLLNDIPENSSENIDMIHLNLPFTYTYDAILSDLLGFQTKENEQKNENPSIL